jgi:hypothetical protein
MPVQDTASEIDCWKADWLGILTAIRTAKPYFSHLVNGIAG